MTCSLGGESRAHRREAWLTVLRMVLAGLLGLHHRVNWKDCVQSEGEDKEDAQKFRKAFAPFLPSS